MGYIIESVLGGSTNLNMAYAVITVVKNCWIVYFCIVSSLRGIDTGWSAARRALSHLVSLSSFFVGG